MMKLFSSQNIRYLILITALLTAAALPIKGEAQDDIPIKYINARGGEGKEPAALASIEALAVVSSDQADGLIIVAHTGNEQAAKYYQTAVRYLDMAKKQGVPIYGFIQGPDDGRHGFDVYADGEVISDEEGFNTVQQLEMVIKHAIKLVAEKKTADH